MIEIRFAKEEDAEAILNIYSYYVLHTAISFAYEVPTLETFKKTMKSIQERYPYLVAIEEGKIVGYAYAHNFVGRTAYDWSSELTIYVDKDMKKSGIGKKLYALMEDLLREMHINNANVCIAYPDEEDEYLNKNSASFHEHMGYQFVGMFHKCGRKFNRWYNMIWMEKMLAEHPENAPEVININDLKDVILTKYGIR